MEYSKRHNSSARAMMHLVGFSVVAALIITILGQLNIELPLFSTFSVDDLQWLGYY